MTGRTRLKVFLCPACAAALRKIRDEQGAEAMARLAPSVLCASCMPPDVPAGVPWELRRSN